MQMILSKRSGIVALSFLGVSVQKLAGTPKKDQKMIVIEDVGHGIPRDTIIANHLASMRKYEIDN